MQIVNLEEAQANVSWLVDAAARGEEIVITKDGTAIVSARPVAIIRTHVRRSS